MTADRYFVISVQADHWLSTVITAAFSDCFSSHVFLKLSFDSELLTVLQEPLHTKGNKLPQEYNFYHILGHAGAYDIVTE